MMPSEFHEVCSIFPLMTPDEYAGLKADIEANGLREPIWIHGGMVVDGRNRLRACQELGIDPQFREWDGDGSLVEFVVSLNLHRRHLDSSQLATCGVKIKQQLAVEARERQLIAASEGGKRSGEVRRESIEGNSSHKGRPKKDLQDTKVREKIPEPSYGKSIPRPRDQAAKLVGTNPRYIQDAEAVEKKDPELFRRVHNGEVSLPKAKREVAQAEKRAELEAKAKIHESSRSESESPWQIIEGDSLEVMTTLERGSARLIFADPPYNIDIPYGDHMDDNLSPEEFLRWSRSWIEAAADHLALDGTMFVLINSEWADEYGCMLRRAGLHRRAWLIWYESFGVNCTNNFNRTSRHLFYMVKDPKRFVFNPEAVKRPSDRLAKYDDARANPGGKIWDDVLGVNPPIPRLVGTAKERIPDFPTQLPLALLTPIIDCASEPGDLILDPFNGSGTTGEAALRLGRRYLGIEKSAKFADLSRMRLRAAEGELHG